MKFPVNHLPDCNMYHYYLQLNLYGFMLEQFGYSIVHIEFEWFDLEEVENEVYQQRNSKIYVVPIMQKEVLDMLNFHKQHNLNK